MSNVGCSRFAPTLALFGVVLRRSDGRPTGTIGEVDPPCCLPTLSCVVVFFKVMVPYAFTHGRVLLYNSTPFVVDMVVSHREELTAEKRREEPPDLRHIDFYPPFTPPFTHHFD